MSCNLIYKDGKLDSVVDNLGNPSHLYKEAVSKFGEEKGLEIYLTSKSSDFIDIFGEKGEPKLKSVLNFIVENNQTQEELTVDHKADLINLSIATPNFSTSNFYDDNGLFVISDKLKPFYSDYELQNLKNDVELQARVKDSIERLKNTQETVELSTEQAGGIEKTSDINSFGKLTNINPNEVKKETTEVLAGVTREEFDQKIQNLDYPKFQETVDKEQLYQEMQGYQKAEVFTEIDGEIKPAKNTNTEDILPLVAKESYNIPMMQDVQDLLLKNLVVLQSSSEATSIVLKSVEDNLILDGVDAIGLSDKEIDEKLINYLYALNSFLISPTKQNTKEYAKVSDDFFERDLGQKTSAIKTEKKDRNFVKLNTNLNEEEVYEKSGLVKVGDGLYVKTSKESLEQLYTNLKTYPEKFSQEKTLEEHIQEQTGKEEYQDFKNVENAEAIELYKMYFGDNNQSEIDFALEQIDKGITLWSGDIGSYRIDLGMAWVDIRKGESDLRRGKYDSVPAKRLIGAINIAKEEGGYHYKIGTGTENARGKEFVSFEDMQRVNNVDNLTENELESLNRERGQQTIQFQTSYVNFTGDVQYLINDYVSDFYVDMLKEKQKNSTKWRNFYSNFEINERGINLKNTDGITMSYVNLYADDNLRQYSLLSKQMPNLQVENVQEASLNNRRDAIVNNPQLIQYFDGDISILNNQELIVKDATQDFIKIGGEIYENIKNNGNISLFSKVVAPLKEYNNYNVEQPTTETAIEDYSYLEGHPENFTKVKGYLNKEEKQKIKEDKFAC